MVIRLAPAMVVKHGATLREIVDYDLDLAFGKSENNFQLDTLLELEAGSLVWIDGSAYGGIIDSVRTATGSHVRTYKGRTWTGMLDDRVVCPPSGQDYYTLIGDLGVSLPRLMADCTLMPSPFGAVTAQTGVAKTFQVDRYVTLFECLDKLMDDIGWKYVWGIDADTPTMAFMPAVTHMVDATSMDAELEKVRRRVNHLIGLGKGELKDRTVVHRYIGADGKVTTRQYYTGVDEVEATYELSDKEGAELTAAVESKLRELQQVDEADMDYQGGAERIDVGDSLLMQDDDNNMRVSAKVTKKIAQVQDGTLTVTVSCDNTTITPVTDR